MLSEQADMESITLRPACPNDGAFLTELYADSRRQEKEAAGFTDEEWKTFITIQFAGQKQFYEAQFPGSDHRIILRGGLPIGRVWVWRTEKEIRILDLTIYSQHQNIGVGTDILQRYQTEAKAAGKPLAHKVLHTNRDAIRLYERLGFTVTGEVGAHYVMEWVPKA